MVRIRKKQMAAFEQQAEVNFVSSVVQQLRSDHAEAVAGLPAKKLRKRVEYGIERAREYGLTWENNLATFVILMFEIAPDFDKTPVFRKYLTDESVPPDDRMDLLLAETTDADWGNVVLPSGPNNWPADIL